MSMPSAYKPSPLGYGSPRTSPFRRPESPASPSPSPLRGTTPSSRPVNSRFATDQDTPTSTRESWTPKGRANTESTMGSPVRQESKPGVGAGAPKSFGHGNALSQLQPAQVRTLREGFQILDRDSDGVVNREDVADMLTQLGLPSSPSAVSQFFPPSTPQTTTLPVFINTIAETLAALSESSELLSAFGAFDDDDTGQVDLAELRDALLNTAPEPGERPLAAAEVDRVMEGFTARRAFNRSMHGGLGKRGEVFRYQDFVHSVMGTGSASEPASAEGSEG